MKNIDFKKKLILTESTDVSFKEDVKSGEKHYFIDTLILPFGTRSRNGRLYDTESAKETHQALVGQYLLYNHKSDGNWADSKPRGEWIETRIEPDGMWGTAKVYNTEYNTEFKEFLKEASNVKVSLNVDGTIKYVESNNGDSEPIVMISAWYEASAVSVPGFAAANTSNIYVENIVKELKPKFDAKKIKGSHPLLKGILDVVTLWNVYNKLFSKKK